LSGDFESKGQPAHEVSIGKGTAGKERIQRYLKKGPRHQELGSKLIGLPFLQFTRSAVGGTTKVNLKMAFKY
jgi:hypothetical protein